MYTKAYRWTAVFSLLLSIALGTSSALAGDDSTSSGGDNVSSSMCSPNCAGVPPAEWLYWKTVYSSKEPCWGGGYMWHQHDVYFRDDNRNGSYNSGEPTEKRNVKFVSC